MCRTCLQICYVGDCNAAMPLFCYNCGYQVGYTQCFASPPPPPPLLDSSDFESSDSSLLLVATRPASNLSAHTERPLKRPWEAVQPESATNR